MSTKSKSGKPVIHYTPIALDWLADYVNDTLPVTRIAPDTLSLSMNERFAINKRKAHYQAMIVALQHDSSRYISDVRLNFAHNRLSAGSQYTLWEKQKREESRTLDNALSGANKLVRRNRVHMRKSGIVNTFTLFSAKQKYRESRTIPGYSFTGDYAVPEKNVHGAYAHQQYTTMYPPLKRDEHIASTAMLERFLERKNEIPVYLWTQVQPKTPIFCESDYASYAPIDSRPMLDSCVNPDYALHGFRTGQNGKGLYMATIYDNRHNVIVNHKVIDCPVLSRLSYLYHASTDVWYTRAQSGEYVAHHSALSDLAYNVKYGINEESIAYSINLPHMHLETKTAFYAMVVEVFKELNEQQSIRESVAHAQQIESAKHVKERKNLTPLQRLRNYQALCGLLPVTAK